MALRTLRPKYHKRPTAIGAMATTTSVRCQSKQSATMKTQIALSGSRATLPNSVMTPTNTSRVSDMNWLTRVETSPLSSVTGTRRALRYIRRRRSIIIRFEAFRIRYCEKQRKVLPRTFTPTSTPSKM